MGSSQGSTSAGAGSTCAVAVAVVLFLWGVLIGDADLAAGGVTTFACLPAAGLAKLARSR